MISKRMIRTVARGGQPPCRKRDCPLWPERVRVWRRIGARLLGGGMLSLALSSSLFAQSSPLTVQPSTGRVGVGNTNPAYPLDVSGTVNATSFRGDGSQLTNLPNSGGITLLDKVATDTTILGNSTVETALYSFSVPGGTLGADNTLRLTLRGRITFWDGDTRRMTFRIKYGATTLNGGLVIQAGSENNSNQAWTLVIDLSGDGATNGQIMHAVGVLQELKSRRLCGRTTIGTPLGQCAAPRRPIQQRRKILL